MSLIFLLFYNMPDNVFILHFFSFKKLNMFIFFNNNVLFSNGLQMEMSF